MVSVDSRMDLIERSQPDVLTENVELRRRCDRLEREVAAALDQAKYCIRKFDQLRAALTDQVPAGKGSAG